VNVRQVKWQNRAHFFAICAQLMRRILVDFARSRGYQKRGKGLNSQRSLRKPCAPLASIPPPPRSERFPFLSLQDTKHRRPPWNIGLRTRSLRLLNPPIDAIYCTVTATCTVCTVRGAAAVTVTV
jgi:hypothetical protein